MEILETNCMDIALCSQKATLLLPEEHDEFLGRLRGGEVKSGVLEHKIGNISETRRGKVNMEGLWELANALSNGTIPTPYSLFFFKIGCLQPPPKTAIAISSGMGEAMDLIFGRNIHRAHPNKSPLKILEKRACAQFFR